MWNLGLNYFKYRIKLGLGPILKIVKSSVDSSIFKIILLHNYYSKVFALFFVLSHVNIFDITGSDLKPWGQESMDGLHGVNKAPEIVGNVLCK